jgi:hypothetical protein
LTWGQGFGTPWGGGPLIPTTSQLAEIAGAPITFDFTDEPDGAFPGTWERFVITTVAAVLSGSAEAANLADYYFMCAGGRGWWRYTRLPAAGTPYEEHGYAASPTGVLVGRNADVAVVVDSPAVVLDPTFDSLTYEVTIGLRASDDVTGFIGGRMRATWSAGVWSLPALECVRSAGGAAPTVVASYDFTNCYNRPEDLWNAARLTELRVIVRDDVLTVHLNGGLQLSAPLQPLTDSSKVVLFVRVFNKKGVTVVTKPVVASFMLRSLRNLAKLGGDAPVAGDAELVTPQLPQLHLPLADLQAKKLVRRTNGREFVFVEEVETNVLGIKRLWNAGAVVVATETPDAMELVPVVVNFAAIRGKRQKGGL